MKHFTFKIIMAKQRFCNKIKTILCDTHGGDDWFSAALKIVIGFIIGGIVLAALIIIFKDDIGGWMKNTTISWFPKAGETRPVV